MRVLRLRPYVHIPIFLIALYLQRKLQKSSAAQHLLNQEASRWESFNFASSGELQKALRDIPSPAVLLLNQYALNITLNFLCNVHDFNGVHQRLIIFAFDHTSSSVLRNLFPAIRTIHWPMPELERRFGMGDGCYQLFQYFRARLAAYLSESVTGDGAWMIQADTIWRQNLFQLVNLTSKDYRNAHVIFDREGDSGLLASMIAGGYFYIRSAKHWPGSGEFFSGIADYLLAHYSTDNNVITRQCIERVAGTNCSFFPYGLIANWRFENRDGAATYPPLFQYDGGEGSEAKFEHMKRNGLLFYDVTQSNGSAGRHDVRIQCLKAKGFTTGGGMEDGSRSRKDNFAIRVAHSIFETLSWLLPPLRHFILTKLFPLYAYYLAV